MDSKWPLQNSFEMGMDAADSFKMEQIAKNRPQMAQGKWHSCFPQISESAGHKSMGSNYWLYNYKNWL